MYMGLHAAARKYHVRPSTLKKMLPWVEHRQRQCKSLTYTEIDTKSLEKFLSLYSKELPSILQLSPETYLSIRQAHRVSKIPAISIYKAVKRGRLKAIRHFNKYFIKVSDLRSYAKEWSKHYNTKHEPNWLFITEISRRELILLNEFFSAVRMAKEVASKRNIPLESGWIGQLIHVIHERQKETGDN